MEDLSQPSLRNPQRMEDVSTVVRVMLGEVRLRAEEDHNQGIKGCQCSTSCTYSHCKCSHCEPCPEAKREMQQVPDI
eukprot:12334868-Prorocentrum_lima.AAC.1